jgi:hypothetical protein
MVREAIGAGPGQRTGCPTPSRLPSPSRKPGAAFAARAGARVVAVDVGDPVVRAQSRRVDRLELDTACAERRHGRFDVLDLEAHLRVLAGRAAG